MIILEGDQEILGELYVLALQARKPDELTCHPKLACPRIPLQHGPRIFEPPLDIFGGRSRQGLGGAQQITEVPIERHGPFPLSENIVGET